jgi:hypothetical protein
MNAVVDEIELMNSVGREEIGKERGEERNLGERN